MKTKAALKIASLAAGLSAMVVMAACAPTKSEKKPQSSETTKREKVLNDKFKSTYTRLDGESMKLAARLLGATARTKVERQSSENDGIYSVALSLALKNPQNPQQIDEVFASGEVKSGELNTLQTNVPHYFAQASCLSDTCTELLARLILRRDVNAPDVTDLPEKANEAEWVKKLSQYSQLALQFKKPTAEVAKTQGLQADELVLSWAANATQAGSDSKVRATFRQAKANVQKVQQQPQAKDGQTGLQPGDVPADVKGEQQAKAEAFRKAQAEKEAKAKAEAEAKQKATVEAKAKEEAEAEAKAKAKGASQPAAPANEGGNSANKSASPSNAPKVNVGASAVGQPANDNAATGQTVDPSKAKAPAAQ